MLTIQLILKAHKILVQTMGFKISRMMKMPATKLTTQGSDSQRGGWNHPTKQESGEGTTTQSGLWVTLASTCYLIHIVRGLYR